MKTAEREVWIAAAAAVEALAGTASVWCEPPRVRKELAELLGALPATHVAVDLAAILAADPAGGWGALLGRAAPWNDRLPELAQAIASATAGRAAWGFVLPAPRTVASALGDASERGIVKAGLQLAGLLQHVRDAGLHFVALDVFTAAETRAVGPILKNAALYGWRRAIRVADLAAERSAQPDLWLVEDAEAAVLAPLWTAGERVAGGLGRRFWTAAHLEGAAPARFLLYGTVPAETEPGAIVAAGRALRQWTG
ncbi:MAG: hypothetical protein QOD06_2950 [Candidatus Binatota bacterium]|jgi:hypothetical protein|nr:hypothetical protein [Candidatus Binatota bacterium]